MAPSNVLPECRQRLKKGKRKRRKRRKEEEEEDSGIVVFVLKRESCSSPQLGLAWLILFLNYGPLRTCAFETIIPNPPPSLLLFSSLLFSSINSDRTDYNYVRVTFGTTGMGNIQQFCNISVG